jgi:hypothetical protein
MMNHVVLDKTLDQDYWDAQYKANTGWDLGLVSQLKII